MPIVSASVSLTRYRIVEDVPNSIWPEIVTLLKRFSFKEIEQTSDERSYGWVSLENFLDAGFRTAPPEKGEYLAFALRLDTRRVSPAVIKKHTLLAMEEAEKQAKEEGRKYLSRERKKEIKEQVRIKLMARAMPIPAVFDVVWNTSTRVVYLASTNNKVRELFNNHFTDTFELHLEPMTPYFQALNALGEDAQPAIDAVESTSFM
ncbi:recombination-associated protein RdgC [Oceanidesulfovibrio marinus]|uniref:recombination-associated protein RdgC n=1 Tax=Oceanidesulfovibrio marinus TaxID=370038 RepID=UPI00148AFC47|nr:recombination-associated protein RdgC [Oceanidesulfovibrio marinus]